MNKSVLLIGLLAATAHAEPLAMNDPNYAVLSDVRSSIDEAWYREGGAGPWLVGDNAGDLTGARCTRALTAAAKAGVPGTRTIPLQNDNPELVRGAHSLDDLRPVCKNIERLAKIKVWEKWAIGAARGGSGSANANSDRKTCNGGQEIHTVRRYQFDATHTLVKTTDALHCGRVPKGAFK